MKIHDFQRHIQQQVLGPLYLILGEESFFRDKALDLLELADLEEGNEDGSVRSTTDDEMVTQRLQLLVHALSSPPLPELRPNDKLTQFDNAIHENSEAHDQEAHHEDACTNRHRIDFVVAYGT